MKIFVDNIPEGVKSITFDVSFHNTFEGGHMSATKEVLYNPESKVSTDTRADSEKPETLPEVNIDDRPPKEIPQEMQDISFQDKLCSNLTQSVPRTSLNYI